jgi:uncharacterized protein with PQ loop repeat
MRTEKHKPTEPCRICYTHSVSYHFYHHRRKQPATAKKAASKRQSKPLIDPLMGVAAVVQPMMATPQIYAIYTQHSNAGVSLLTWLGFMLIGLVFLLYGIAHRIKPFIITQILWFIVDFLVVIGVLIYN